MFVFSSVRPLGKHRTGSGLWPEGFGTAHWSCGYHGAQWQGQCQRGTKTGPRRRQSQRSEGRGGRSNVIDDDVIIAQLYVLMFLEFYTDVPQSPIRIPLMFQSCRNEKFPFSLQLQYENI